MIHLAITVAAFLFHMAVAIAVLLFVVWGFFTIVALVSDYRWSKQHPKDANSN